MNPDITTESRVFSTPVLKRSSRKKRCLQSYDETLMDNLIEQQLGGAVRKRTKTHDDMEKETEIEAMIALSLGFPIDTLLEEEIESGVVCELGGKEQNDYIVVRNHILSKWRSNVGMWLSRGKIRETVSKEYEHLICSAYDFLMCNGYVNFGVSPPFTPHIPNESNEGSVIVIGAGLSGLAAARQLISFGLRVIVLEGRKRPGGRVYTEKMGQEGECVWVDLGGSVITGIHANPLGVLARQLAIPLHKIRDRCPLYKPDGTLVDPEIDSRVEGIFNKLLDKVTELRKLMGGIVNDVSLGSVLETLCQLYTLTRSSDERKLLDWHFANLEYANAGCLSNLSAAYWDQDDPYEMGGDHCFLAGSNSRLIDALCNGVPVFYNEFVNMIKYGDEGVEVVAGNQVFQADMVLCTIPLGVLKKGTIKFQPELPQRKREAIERLGFGLLNKVVMVFPYVFWGEELDMFGCLNEKSSRRGEFFLFYSYHTVSEGAVLTALVSGEAACSFESEDPSFIILRVLSILKGIYNQKGIDVPNPLQTLCTRWGRDPLSYGSYSHVRVGASGEDYDILAESIANRVFFAGEATSRQHPASMHGAFLSGLREASRISRAAKCHNFQQKRSIQKNIQSSNDILDYLFLNPDLQIGSFLFVFNSSMDETASMGIIKVTFKSNELIPETENSFQQVCLYSVVSRTHTKELESVSGGDEERLLFLVEVLGLKLMGAGSNVVNTLAAGIASARRGRGRRHIVTSVVRSVKQCNQLQMQKD